MGKVTEWEGRIYGEVGPEQGWVWESSESCTLNTIATNYLHWYAIKFKGCCVSRRVTSEVVIQSDGGKAKGSKDINYPERSIRCNNSSDELKLIGKAFCFVSKSE